MQTNVFILWDKMYTYFDNLYLFSMIKPQQLFILILCKTSKYVAILLLNLKYESYTNIREPVRESIIRKQ